MNDDIPDNWRDNPLENTPPIRGAFQSVSQQGTLADNAFLLRQIARDLDGEATEPPCSEASVCRNAADEIERLKKALAWLYGAYQQECGFPLDALENSLIHVPIILEAIESLDIHPTAEGRGFHAEAIR